MGKENIEKESEQTVKFSGEEYVKMYRPQMDFDLNVKSTPKFRCPDCGGIVRRCEGFCLATYPPQHRYECDDCDYTTTLTF